MNSSMLIHEIFYSPQEMADSLLQNWRCQRHYQNRKYMQSKDYANARETDFDIPESLRENYNKCMQRLQNKLCSILCVIED